MDKTEKAIIKTLSFYDLLARPLMLEEIWRNLYQCESGKLQVLMGLKNLMSKGMVGEKTSDATGNIYYHLFGHEKIVPKYFHNFQVSSLRHKKVTKTLKYFQFDIF